MNATKPATETVAPKDLKVGDVITGIDAAEFPFPFEINSVQVLGGGVAVQITATHGWFAMCFPHFQVRRAI